MEIVPMRDLKDTVKIECLCKDNGKIFVTKNGYGRLVVMDIEYYKKMYEQLEEAIEIIEGIKQAQEGNVVSGPDLIKEIQEKYGL